MTHSDLSNKLFKDWAKQRLSIPDDASPEERRLWEELAEAERQCAGLEADWNAFERDLYGDMEPWQFWFAMCGEIGVELFVFDYLEAERKGVKFPAWPSRDQLPGMRQGLSEIDQLAVSGELEVYQADLKERLESRVNLFEVEANKGWFMAQGKVIRNLNLGSERVRSETDRLARLHFGYRPEKDGKPAHFGSFAKEKRLAMEMLSEDIPAFSPPRGKNHKSLPLSWAGEETLILLDAMRSKVLGDGMSRNAAAKAVAAERTARNPEYYKTILGHFRQRMRLRPGG